MEQYYYEYEQDSIYCYPDSFILKNKLNIRDQETLEEAERNITALRILELNQFCYQFTSTASSTFNVANNGIFWKILISSMVINDKHLIK